MIKVSYLLSLAVFSIISPLTSSYGAELKTKIQDCTFKVSGMTCASCGLTLKTAVKKIKAVQNVKVEYDEKKAIVSFPEGSVESAEIISKIHDLGYEATLTECKHQS